MAFEQQSHLTAERRLRYRSRLVAVLALAPIVALPFLCNLGVTFSWSYLKLFALQTAVLVACAGLFIVRPAGAVRMLGASGVGLPMVFVLLWGAMSTMWSNVPWAAVQPLVELGYMALGGCIRKPADQPGDPEVVHGGLRRLRRGRSDPRVPDRTDSGHGQLSRV